MVLQIDSSWIFIIVPRDAPCQISQFWVYPIVPFPWKQPKYGPFIAKTLSSHGPSNWFFLNLNVPRDVQCQISPCWVYHVAPVPRNGQNMALLWQKHGLHMVLKFGSSWVLSIVPRNVPCQISLCWVHPVAPFPRNGQNMALYGQNMVLTWSLKLVLPES